MALRNLLLVLGDQLDPQSSGFDDFDPDCDAVWMAEVAEETRHVWCHKLRIAVFFAAMRHFRDELRQAGHTVHYTELPVDGRRDRGPDFASVLRADLRQLAPQRLILVQPGDYRVQQALLGLAQECGLPLEIREDRHFYTTPDEFRHWARGRRGYRLETFYRWLRKKHRVLVDDHGNPTGGQWNYDHDNRESFGRQGPPADLPRPVRRKSNAILDQVFDLVERRFADHPGRLQAITVPLTRRQAREALRRFIDQGLPRFGQYEDAMWGDEPFLYHSRLSVPLNLKLLDPRECVAAAVEAYQAGAAPLASVEGFVRQILGWREFVRGIYWTHMPEYAQRNALDAQEPLPQFYWDGQTDLECVRQAMHSVLEHGYTHHIQRLMVLGNLALLAGVNPAAFHNWHMAMYLDAVDWVSLPNALGMSQFGDGGLLASKPYCASGNYIQRMSNHCGHCRYDPRQATGNDACPVTTLYWDFLARHRQRLANNPRMALALKNLDRRTRHTPEFEQQVRQQADAVRTAWQSASAE